MDPRLALAQGGALAMRRVRQVRFVRSRRNGRGKRLRALRLVRGLTLRAVHHASVVFSKRLRNSEFVVPVSRLHEFETRNVVPSIHRLYTLATIYGCEISELLGLYGVPQHVSKGTVEATVRA